MTDQAQRLEIATVRAEIGSNITYRFNNDAIDAGGIPTESGDIPNLKQVILQLQEDGAEKISFATTIYPTTAAGIAATTDGVVFLVVSNQADEIYAVYTNTAGVAVDTGKRALSSQAVQDAMQAATEAAEAAQDAADLSTQRTARFLAHISTPPVIRDDGTTLQIGDRYVNTGNQAEYIYKATGWASNDSLAAIADIQDATDPAKGAAQVGWDGEKLSDQLNQSKKLASYAAMRAYTGPATRIVVTNSAITGAFTRRAFISGDVDNGGTTIVSTNGQWTMLRDFIGYVMPEWFGAKGDKVTDDSTAFVGAFATSLPLRISKHYAVKQRFTVNGPLALIGITREASGLIWPADATSVGISCTVTNLETQVTFSDVELVNESAAGAADSLLFATWSGLSGYSLKTYFYNRFMFLRSSLKCSGAGRSLKMCEMRNLYGGLIVDAYVMGATKTATDAAAGYPTTFGFHSSNDGSASNTVGIKYINPKVYSCKTAVQTDDVEGVEINFPDFQACWDGYVALNVIRRANQFRVNGGHIGVNNSAVRITNARHAKVLGTELSWGSNRANGAAITYVEFIGVESPEVLGATVRGNAALATYGHTLTGIGLSADATSGSTRGVVDGNVFQDLTTACTQDATSIALLFGIGNSFNNVTNRLNNSSVAGGSASIKYGSGPHVNPTGVAPLFLLASVGGSALALNRDAPGSVQTYHIAGAAAAGVVSCTSTTTTYGTTSDMTLKTDDGELSAEDAKDILAALKVHRFEWKVNGEKDIGFFAQELHEVYPGAVIKGGWRDGQGLEASEGAEGAHYESWAVGESKLVIPIVRALQDALARIENLEQRLLPAG